MKKALEKNKKVRIANFEEGSVSRISGTIVYGGKILKAPLSARSCSYCHILVERNTGSKNSRWVTFVEEKLSGEVIIKDGDFYALVQNNNLMNTYILPDKHYTSGFLHDATPELKRYLEKHGESSEGFMGMNHTLRYNEGILEEGETVTLSGKGTWKTTASLHLNLPVDKILVIILPQEGSVYLTDDPELNRDLN